MIRGVKLRLRIDVAMDAFQYRDGQLFAEDVALEAVAATHGTPCYVYSRATLERHWRAFDQAFADQDHLVCYAVKANSNLAVLNILARLGSGFDIVSVGELERVLAAGGDPGKVVFSGVGKRGDEIRRALELDIACFNVESENELQRIQEIAASSSCTARVSIRVNPDVDARTHPYIATGLKENKFGIDISAAPAVYRRASRMPNIEVVGIDCHIGSQLTSVEPFVDALDRLLDLASRLQGEGIRVSHLDLGGGLGVAYREEQPPSPVEYAAAVLSRFANTGYKIIIEPGRAIVANAGVLLTRIEYLKHGADHEFAVVDAGMNDLLRPALYQAWQAVLPVRRREEAPIRCYDVVGPVCETGDFLAKAREMAVCEGDLLVVRGAGAYGFVMSSNYNTRPRAAEVMVDGDRAIVVRRRERIEELFEGESVLP
jgi:diaminopimelate decarboxylase